MNYRKFAKSGLEVSEVSLGAEHLEFLPKKQVLDVISAAIDHGMNYMDFFMSSANVRDYGKIALKGRREKMMVAGHLGSIQIDNQYSRSNDLKQSEIYFNDLLTRLDTDYIDMLMLHFIDDKDSAETSTNIDGLLGLAQKFIKQGKARMLGFSSHIVPIAEELVKTGLFDGVMFSINPLFDAMPIDIDLDEQFEFDISKDNPSMILDEKRQAFYRFCELKECSIIVMKGYGAGRLLKKDNGLSLTLTPSQCIEYALTRPGTVTLAAGCRTVKEVEAAAYYCNASDEEKDFSTVFSSKNLGGSGHCMYCNHCLPCPQEIDIAKNIGLIDAMIQGSKAAAEKYSALSPNGSDCTECRDCEGRCPFSVEIVDKLNSGSELADSLLKD